MVAWSAVAHLGATGLVVYTPGNRSMTAPQVIAVELVAPPASALKAPSVRASPPPPKPKPKQIVLPEKPRGPKPKPEPKTRRREEVVLEPEKKQEKSLDDLLAEMRNDAGETPAETPEIAVAPTPAPEATEGAGQQVSAEILDWVARTKRHVRRAWVVPPGFRTLALETHVVVTLDATGRVVREPRIARRSGNPWFDEGVVRGIAKASPLPAPPEAGDWDFVFMPGDSL